METTPPLASAVDDLPLNVGTVAADAELIPAASGQRRLWFLEQMEPGTPLYNIPYLARLCGPLDVRALGAAFAAIVERHQVLRTNFVAVGSEPMLQVRSGWTLDLPVTDLTGAPAGTGEAELSRLVEEEARQPFDLAHGLMLRVRLYRLAPEEHALLLVMHHIASDGWSMAILYRELGACYQAFGAGAGPALPSLPVQYADYAQWQREYLQGETLKRLVDFWKKAMAGAPALLELPADRPRPPIQSRRGGNVRVAVPGALVSALKQVSGSNRVTLFMTLLAGFTILVHRYTGQTDLVIGSSQAGRDVVETEGLIGFFINSLALRADLGGDPTVRELLARIREVTLAAYEHREMPYEKLVEELQPQRNLSFDPVCQVFFMLQNVPAASLRLPGIELSIEPVHTGTAKADLTVWATEQADCLDVAAEFNADIFERGTIERMMGHYVTILEGIVADADRRISQLALLTTAEQRRILHEWNATAVDYPRDKTIHDLFAEQAARTPDATALVSEDRELTYAELGARVERLAARLRALGAGPDVLIAICAERSLDMVIGLLGILKSGAAYVPLDPTYPPERLAYMLQDSRAAVLVTQTGMLPRLPAHEATVVCVGDVAGGPQTRAPEPRTGNPGAGATRPSRSSLAGETRGDSLAYVLYTSGSTGDPKGVMVTHRNVVNFFAGMDRVLGTEPGGWLAVTSISFDISVLELFWTLARGFKVVILSSVARMPGSAILAAAPARHHVDFAAPSDAARRSLGPPGEGGGVWPAGAGAARPPLSSVASEGGRTFSLPEQIAVHGVTHLQCTPSFARMLSRNGDSLRALRSLRKLLVGGEALPNGLAQELRRSLPGEIINMYGPTETTVWSSTHRVIDETSTTGAVAIGRPIANTQIRILDSNRQPLPVGVPGELWIGGDGVARGYLRRPELTDEKFVPDPFAAGAACSSPPSCEPETPNPEPQVRQLARDEAFARRILELGTQDRAVDPRCAPPAIPPSHSPLRASARMYRTGDRARLRPDGVIDFLGRVDFQVKIRGHRVELGEIEAALMERSDVRQAVVALRTDTPDDPRLVAYLVPACDAVPATNVLRDFLKRKLPDHMVPAIYVTVDQLPLTPNGKVDRRALPAPPAAVGPDAAFVPPAGELEQTLAAIWRETLQVGRVGADDNFFDFGGHSLQVVQVQDRLREALRLEVPVLTLFQYPTIRSLAKFLGGDAPDQSSWREKFEERNRRRQSVIAPHRRPPLAEETT